jgi:hypothetical protein
MRAISALATEMPVKPKRPAMIDMTKKKSAHLRRVIGRSLSLMQYAAALIRGANFPTGPGFLAARGDYRVATGGAAQWPLLDPAPDGNIASKPGAGTHQ